MSFTDDAIRVSNSARVLEQLRNLYRCVHLAAFLNSASIDDSKLKLSIHTLSRALEIEENASCEALWLLYLHLSSLLPNRDFDSEFEMAEQAMNCIAASHELWIHYVAVGKLDSIQVSEELHCRILWHLSKPGFGVQHDDSKKSRLLVSTLFHMCVKLCHAGNRARAVELVAAILQLKQLDGPEPEWCKGVRSQLNCSDVAILSMTFAHLMLFLEMPRCIEMWLRVSGHQQVHISSFAYSAELFEEYQSHFKSLPNEDINFSIAAYELAFTRMKSQSSQEWHRFMDVILNNWMLLVAFQDIKKHGDTRSGVELFLEEHRTEIVKCPGASFSIAKLLAKQQERILHAHQLMVDVMNQSSVEQFPEALHYYLFACQGFSGADPPDTDFPALLDVVLRLSRGLDVNHEEIQRSIADIRVDTNPFGKVKALKKLLYGLLLVWMDQLAATSSQSKKQPEYLKEESVNVFAALDICQLMSMLLEPSVAIEGLDLVLSSSKFKMLSSESRQFAWALRFIFQLDRSVRAKPRPESFRPVRSALLQLFHRYLECMNTVTECTMQASHRLSEAVEHRGVQAAIIECLYPQQKPWNVLDGNLEIFQLCLAATPPLELSSLFGSTYYAFSPSPVFCLAYA
uniref:Uncharacterized protein n=1 Tax=Globisporangium ultimum (strain ATCC 200006 / CBS 805.95 / DAOM BR144) TaxID=431595 RepID=K3WYP6_GLOUD